VPFEGWRIVSSLGNFFHHPTPPSRHAPFNPPRRFRPVFLPLKIGHSLLNIGCCPEAAGRGCFLFGALDREDFNIQQPTLNVQ
jgi:hypothetical protein